MKKWHESRTVIVALLTIAAGVLGVLLGSDLIAQNPELVAALTSVLGVVNLVLRLLTDRGIESAIREPKQ